MKRPVECRANEKIAEDLRSEAIRYAELQAQFEGMLDRVWSCEAWERKHPLTVSTYAPGDKTVSFRGSRS